MILVTTNVAISQMIMSKITANYAGYEIVITEDDGKVEVYYEGGDGFVFKTIMDDLAFNSEPMGGTFYPEVGTMLAYYWVLKNSHIAESVRSIEVEGDIGEIPCAENRIY